MGGRRLNGARRPAFSQSGEILNDLGRTGAIIRDRHHICAPPAP
jgi:hypothetical protein